MRPKFAKAVQRLASAAFEDLEPLTVGLVTGVARPKKPIEVPAAPIDTESP